MITFKKFLKEEKSEFVTRTKEISYEEAKEILRTKCSQFLKSNSSPKIYRGIDKDVMFGLVNPSSSTRTSANTSNHYTLLIDNSPRWKDYPKRSKSIICSSDFYRAEEFGIPYIVIPFDGAKIGVCPEFDFWDGFNGMWKKVGAGKEDYNTLEEFNMQLEDFYRTFSGKKVLPDVSWESMKAALESAAAQIPNAEPSTIPHLTNYVGRYLMNAVKNGKSAILTLQELMSPITNNFDLVDNTEISNVKGAKELWTDSNCILFNPSLYVENIINKSKDNSYNFDTKSTETISKSGYSKIYTILRKDIFTK